MWKYKDKGYGGWWVAIVVIGLALTFGAICLEGWLVMLLWNAVMPLIWAEAPKLSFWAAVGVLLLCNILFKAVGGSGGGKKK